MLKYTNIRTIEVQDWDSLVEETYQRPYSFQQQDGCKSRGVYDLEIPSKYNDDDEMNDSIPEEVNGEIMGVKFEKWLARDPKQPIINQEFDFELKLFWERNFYPCIEAVANDLHKKGLIEAGKYRINIDW
jgi:hypothetical protein